MRITQSYFFIYTKKVFVSHEFQFCLSKFLLKFTPQDSFLCLVIWHHYHLAESFIKPFSGSCRQFSRKICLEQLFYREHVCNWFFKNELPSSVISRNFRHSKKKKKKTVQGLSLRFVGLLFTKGKPHYKHLPGYFLKSSRL